MRILLGGSFDPVHEGHLRTAQALARQVPGGRVALLPAARSPLKQTLTPDHQRAAMLRQAIADRPELLLDERELQRPPPSYTVDTLSALRQELGPAESLVWVVGSDTLPALSRWKDWQELTRYAHLLVVERPGSTALPAEPVQQWLASLPTVSEVDQLQCFPCGRLVRVALPPQPYSSTAIRAALRARHAGSACPDGLPRSVWHYILENDLYLSDNGHEAQ